MMFDNARAEYDRIIVDIADYVLNYNLTSDLAFETAKYCLMDSLGCAVLALHYPECTKLLGPWVPNNHTDNGVPVPGTGFKLDPIKAAFDITTCIRWLDFNDTWLAAEWGHPSDNLGAILACADYANKKLVEKQQPPITMQVILDSMIKAHEIQGILALQNSFNQVGLDHVILVKLASVALATKLLGAKKQQIMDAISQAWIDGHSLRTYRHAPNTGSRKSWAAGDATSRAVRLALLTLQGEKGCPSALTAPKWGFSDVLFNHQEVEFAQPLGSYVMENILFKISYPAEFHGQTAVECAIKIHHQIKSYLDDIDNIQTILIETQKPAMRIINKTGELRNYADRDHCLQYMVAVGLLTGELTSDSYLEKMAEDPRIDKLREKMIVEENTAFSKDYLDPKKRSIANEITVKLTHGGTYTESIEYPVGHPRRRKEGIPMLLNKFKTNLASFYSENQCQKIQAVFDNADEFENMSVSDFLEMFQK
jgi:2-methylcitrate dehydratase